MPNKMERFTYPARRVLSIAQDEAERLQHNYIGTEHLLLGLMREQEGVAHQVLGYLGLEKRRVEELVERLTRATTRIGAPQLELSPDTKRALELAVDDARRMGHHYIGTEHLLLGMVRQSEGIVIDVLKRLGVSPAEVRRQVIGALKASLPSPSVVARETTHPPKEAKILDEVRDTVQLHLYSNLLLRLLAELAETLNADEKKKMGELIENRFSKLMEEESITMLREGERYRLLYPLVRPFLQSPD